MQDTRRRLTGRDERGYHCLMAILFKGPRDIEASALFQVRRRIAFLFGAVIPTALIIAFFIAYKLNAVSGSAFYWLLPIVIVSCTTGAVYYKCPYCNHFPEEDVPNFNPATCDHCDAILR